MDYVAVGFLGVLVGAAAAAGTAYLLLHRMIDRDLMERRLRALVSLREAMGTPRAPGRTPEVFLDALELDQAIHDFENAVRELRLTSWIFDDRLRADLGRPVREFEEEVRGSREGGRPVSSFKVVEAHRQLDLVLRQAVVRSLDEFRRWRIPGLGKRTPGPGENGNADVLSRDLATH